MPLIDALVRLVGFSGFGHIAQVNTNNLLETLLDKIVRDIGPGPINTTLQDFMKGRYSETDMINGLISDERRKSGGPSPVSDVIVELTRQIHAGELKPDLSNLDLIHQQMANVG